MHAHPLILSLLLFPFDHPELFDAVVANGCDQVEEIQVKQPGAIFCWIWGVIRMFVSALRALHRLWR